MRPIQSVKSLANNINDPGIRQMALRIDENIQELYSSVQRLGNGNKPVSPIIVVSRGAGGNGLIGPVTWADLSGVMTRITLSANQVISSETAANVTGMAFNIEQANYYHFRFLIIANTASQLLHSNPGLVLTLTKPSTTVFCANASDALITYNDTGDPGIDFLSIYEGIIVPSTAGTIQLQAANSDTTTNTTIRQASLAILTKLS
jgi:hypothetical protein